MGDELLDSRPAKMLAGKLTLLHKATHQEGPDSRHSEAQEPPKQVERGEDVNWNISATLRKGGGLTTLTQQSVRGGILPGHCDAKTPRMTGVASSPSLVGRQRPWGFGGGGGQGRIVGVFDHCWTLARPSPGSRGLSQGCP